ncbi:diacylglycerol kinase family protein [Atopococcus tabaci]|uniref:diacylglycerol kinase family protein n=1 Tax=Atopococcus tabaci TaxID=269774 RepID=UPI00240A5965|nr:diacylglycerol kinase family protein [Atopococcus tabaci]
MDLKDDNQLPTKNRNYFDSFKYAFTGVRTVFQEERNMRTHVILAILVIGLCFFLEMSRADWLWILLAIFLMLVMEIWNTVVENIIDLVTDYRYHPLAKKVKDMAAAAVLLTAGFSIVSGLIVLLPKVLNLFF